MQAVEKNNVRAVSPFLVAAQVAVLGSFLMAAGCQKPGANAEKIEPPPTAIMPPSSTPTNALTLIPPSAQPDFKTVPPPPPLTLEQAGGITYKVKSGDSLAKIAAHYNVSARELAQLNGISNPNKISVGQKLVLPAYAKEGAASHKKSTSAKSASSKSGKTTVKKSTAAKAPKATAEGGEYTVKSGDSLGKIAINHHTTVAALKSANGLTSDKLKIGQKLKIAGKAEAAAPAEKATPAPVEPTPAPAVPAVDPTAPVAPAVPAVPAPAVSTPAGATPAVPAPAAAPATVQTFEVTVEAGDTLDGLATKYGVMPADIKKLNNITEVAAGQKIKLPLPTP